MPLPLPNTISFSKILHWYFYKNTKLYIVFFCLRILLDGFPLILHHQRGPSRAFLGQILPPTTSLLTVEKPEFLRPPLNNGNLAQELMTERM